VLIQETPHEHFKRDGNNIYYDLTLTIPQAVLGAEVEVPTLKGKAKLRIEEGTQPGKLLRMRGKGIIGLNGSGEGDQYVRLNVYIPKKLTEKERTAIESLQGNDNFATSNQTEEEKGFFSKMKDVFGG
jgi:molecular chaperone DnaJ